MLSGTTRVTGKPIGGYVGQAAPPPWMSFGMLDPQQLPPWRRPGFGLVVQIGFHESPLEPAGVVALRARRTLEAAGLWNDVLAFCYGEEWYARFDAGAFAAYGLPAGHPEGVHIIRDYVGRQQIEIVQATGRPIVWVTPEVTAERQPPPATTYVAIDRYPVDGEAPEAYGAALIANERATSLPLVLIPRWFRSTGPQQGPAWQLASEEPSRSTIEIAARVLARPRWVAAVGFLWTSRPHAELVGLADMPATRAAVESLFVGV